MGEATKSGVEVVLSAIVEGVRKSGKGFVIEIRNRESLEFDAVILATGSAPKGYEIARSLGHEVTETVPSLFTFNVVDPRLNDLSGVAFDRVELKLNFDDVSDSFAFAGPMLITHWGLSGPAVLKLSAFAAKALFHENYQANLQINFCPSHTIDHVITMLNKVRTESPRQKLSAVNPFNLPKRFWTRLVEYCGISDDGLCANLTSVQVKMLATELKQGLYRVTGKGQFKEEFVTCGGVNLKEINFQTMESKVTPRLYIVGELLDIDGITGGFNFQNAWTTGWLAAAAAVAP
jgi:predicted Rossmann fold flavoprotein